MKPWTHGLIKAGSIIITLLMLSLSFIINLNTSIGQSELSNDQLRPEFGDYWEYERRDYSDNSRYRYNLTMTGEDVVFVANKKIDVLVLEGYGNIERWPNNLEPAEENQIYIKKLINKENLELIKYTQYIDLVYIEDGKESYRYIHENMTYNFQQFTKPSNITIGTNWTKKVIRTEDKYVKTDEPEPQKIVHAAEINSTFQVDNVYYTTVGEGSYKRSYNTLMVQELQWNNLNDTAIIDTTIEYYYADEINGYAKKIRRDFSGEIVEDEVLIKFEKYKPPVTNDGNKNTGDNWFDLNNQYFQILIVVLIIILVCAIVGYIQYKRSH